MADTSNLDALIARNITDIEAALAHARGLGHGLIEEIANILSAELGDVWLVEPDMEDDDTPLRVARRDWIGEGSKPWNGGYSLRFNEKAGPGELLDETWFSVLMNAGPNDARIAVYFWSQTFGPKRRWARLVDDQRLVIDKLLTAGFEQDSDGWLYLPFKLDRDLVAKGYEDGDMNAALMPAKDLAEIVKSASEQLEAVIERDRVFE